MNSPAILTLGRAAKLLGRSKPTVSDWCEKGQLPYSKNGKGHYQIQLADLQRLYPDLLREQELKLEANSKPDIKTSQLLTPDNDAALQFIKELTAKLETSHERVVRQLEEKNARLVTQLAETKSLEDKRSPEDKARDAQAVAEAERLKSELERVKVDIELTPKTVRTKRRLTLWERLKGEAEVLEIDEQAEEVA